jgi:hypothetical protein
MPFKGLLQSLIIDMVKFFFDRVQLYQGNKQSICTKEMTRT